MPLIILDASTKAYSVLAKRYNEDILGNFTVIAERSFGLAFEILANPDDKLVADPTRHLGQYAYQGGSFVDSSETGSSDALSAIFGGAKIPPSKSSGFVRYELASSFNHLERSPALNKRLQNH